jgi:ribonuclease D
LSLKDDYHAMNRLREVHPQGFIDLQDMVKDFGIGEGSLTKIYAILFGLRISKGQRLTNWEAVELTDAQKHYAALDAYACLRIYNHLLQLKKSGEKIV